MFGKFTAIFPQNFQKNLVQISQLTTLVITATQIDY